MKTHFDFNLLSFSLTLFAILVSGFSSVFVAGDAAAMVALRDSLDPPSSLGWSGPDPCEWAHVGCSGGRVTRIQIGHQGLAGTLPETLRDLAGLERLELQFNSISGPIPSLAGMTSLQVLMLSHNNLTSVPKDLFAGMTSLRSVEVDENPFSPWELPETLRDAAASLQNLSANAAGLAGGLPEFVSGQVFPALTNLHLAFNNLSGGLPRGLSGSQIRSLWLNGQDLSGDIGVIGNMTSLEEVWLHSNSFSGYLPDFSGLKDLEVLSLRDNQFTGPVPASLVNLESLRVVNLTNNLLQGPVPEFKPLVDLDNELSGESNRFCLSKPGKCDSQVTTLLLIAESMGYPVKFAENWRGNDACADWIGIACRDGNVTVINFEKMGLNGTISPEFASLKSLQRVILAGNNLTGTVPVELAALPLLTVLDVTNNKLHGKIPKFGNSGVSVKTDGNPDMGKDESGGSSQGLGIGPSSGSGGSGGGGNGQKKNIALAVIIGISVVVGIVAVLALGFLAFSAYKKRKHFSRVQSPNAAMVIHPRDSGSDNDTVKITVAGSSVSVGPAAITGVADMAGGSNNNIQMVESGNLVISIQVLRSVTDNFSEDNVLGQGGFGTVYKGELHDGTMIAVKRMESGVIAGKGLSEFKSEIAVLTKVRHRHLVALLGYCLDGNEKLLVYEYMPRGTLSSHIFNWAVEGLKPLEWTRRLTIALDVARGVEYLHSLAHQSFIHRDLKPSNILLGDDMRAKVADFGLVRLAPEGKGSVETRIAGTFGYLAPEYAVTGRVTTKVDIFSFGVILMELITGRKALDERQPEESMHLVTWFKRMHINPDSFRKAIDTSLDLSDEDTLASISTVAELAGHCCAREPYQRPDMGHAVNVLSSLIELWKPSDDQCPEDMYGIDLEMSLPQALKKWQAYEGRSNMESSSSSLLPSLDNTQTSIPTRPYGFAETFSSSDGR